MSFAAIVAIVALHEHPRARAWFARRDEGWPARIGRALFALVLTGLAVEIALMPIALFHFHKAGLYGALANVVAIPLTTFVIMPLEALALLFDLAGLGAPFWWLTGQALSFLLWLAHAAGDGARRRRLAPRHGARRLRPDLRRRPLDLPLADPAAPPRASSRSPLGARLGARHAGARSPRHRRRPPPRPAHRRRRRSRCCAPAPATMSATPSPRRAAPSPISSTSKACRAPPAAAICAPPTSTAAAAAGACSPPARPIMSRRDGDGPRLRRGRHRRRRPPPAARLRAALAARRPPPSCAAPAASPSPLAIRRAWRRSPSG